MVLAAVFALWFLAGAAIEVLNALSRQWTVARMGRASAAVWIAGGIVLRLACTSAVLVLAFRQGIASGAAALIGYVCSRWAMVLWMHRRLGEGERSQGQQE